MVDRLLGEIRAEDRGEHADRRVVLHQVVPRQALKACRGRKALLHEQARQFQVAGPVLVVRAVLVAQQGHGRGKVQPLAGVRAVKALGKEGVVAAVEALGPAGGHLQAGGLGQLVHDGFPGADVVLVLPAGELGNPQLSVLVHHAGLGPRPAQ